jgi:hypothetical protein
MPSPPIAAPALRRTARVRAPSGGETRSAGAPAASIKRDTPWDASSSTRRDVQASAHLAHSQVGCKRGAQGTSSTGSRWSGSAAVSRGGPGRRWLGASASEGMERTVSPHARAQTLAQIGTPASASRARAVYRESGTGEFLKLNKGGELLADLSIYSRHPGSERSCSTHAAVLPFCAGRLSEGGCVGNPPPRGRRRKLFTRANGPAPADERGGCTEAHSFSAHLPGLCSAVRVGQ